MVQRTNINDLVTFLAVVRAGSFTKAAATLGVSQPALSRTLRLLEEQLGIRLLTRTTRNISATDAGQRLLDTVGPLLDQVQAGVTALADLRDKPAGNLRITTTEHAAENILWPAVQRLTSRYPDIGVEIVVDFGLSNIVADRFDAGIRIGEAIERDMVAVPIGPHMQMAVVGSPDYFARHQKPRTPQELVNHRCINIRLQTAGGLYSWEFERDGRAMSVRVDGKLTFNTSRLVLKAALSGDGLGFLPEDQLRSYLSDGRLERVLQGWCPSFPGYHLYYPSRKHISSAFRLLIDELRI
jgi:DNA-binding transcriptional LysR family regulator